MERLTHEMEEEVRQYIETIDGMGGMIPAIEKGFPQREIQDASYQHQKAVETKREIVVGMNEFQTDETLPVKTLHIGPETGECQIQRLERLRSRRNYRAVKQKLSDLKEAARSDQNLMPFLIDAVKEYATLGELCGTLKEVFGEYQEPSF